MTVAGRVAVAPMNPRPRPSGNDTGTVEGMPDRPDHRGPDRHAWTARELVVLGTSAQSPTAARNQTGHVVRWGSEVLLFDPGEGTQRQLVRAGIPVSQITRICITHAHGDHCLGLAGVLQRRSLDPQPAPIDVHAPASMLREVESMLSVTTWDRDTLEVRVHGTHDADSAALAGGATLAARALDHTVDTIGWRVELAPARHLIPERLDALGVFGEHVARLRRDGVAVVDGLAVRIEDVSRVEPGAAFAFVMDTRPCSAAVELARDADLVVIESTYLDAEEHLAVPHGHSTARQAATVASLANARRLVLAHYSERYPDESAFAAEAASVHPDVVAARDLDVVRAPARG